MKRVCREWKLALILLLLLVLRFASLGWLALSDPTESRYADVGVRIAETGRWVMPQVLINGQFEDYWGKPPLHFWLTAASFRTLGLSEFAARFPSFLAGLLTVGLTYLLALRIRNERTALLACLILTSSELFFVVTGASAIDATLTAMVTGAMVSFALGAVLNPNRTWGWLFFVFLAGGMLAKGPVAAVLVALPIAAWCAATGNWKLLARLPWKSGLLLFSALTLPWYVLAERESPGFLRYFLINEHILRYLVHNYGDRYGSGHLYPYGSSWLMLALSFLPWTPVLLYILIRQRRTILRNAWLSYAAIWGLAPALFFTLSRQLLATYLLPGFAGLSIAIAIGLLDPESIEALHRITRRLQFIPLSLLAIVGTAGFLFHISPWLIAGSALLVLSLFLAVELFVARSISSHVCLTALACVLITTLSMYDFRGVIDSRSSTKSLISYVMRDKGYSGETIRFSRGYPYSAYFYERQYASLRPLASQDATQPRHEILVFTGKDWDRLDAPARARLHPVFRYENWIACREATAAQF